MRGCESAPGTCRALVRWSSRRSWARGRARLEASSYLALALFGGLAGLDAVSCPQAMISRPLVAGPLTGLLFGDPTSGMWAGLLLEILSLRQLPVGGARYWDSGPAAVVAAVAVVHLPPGSAGLVVGVGLGVLVGWAGGWSVHAMRGWNAQLVASLGEQPVAPARLVTRHLSAMGIDFVRGAMLTVVTVGVVELLSRRISDFPDQATPAAALLLLAAASLAVGVDLRTMAKGGALWGAFAVGALLTIVLWASLG